MSRYYRENPDEEIRHDWTGAECAAANTEPIGVTESLQRIYFGPKNLHSSVESRHAAQPEHELSVAEAVQAPISSGGDVPPVQNPFSDSVHITVIRDQHTKQPSKATDTAICVEVEVEVKEFHRGTNPQAFDPQRQDGHEVVLGEARVSEDAIGYELLTRKSLALDRKFTAFRKGDPIELTKGELNAAEEKAIEEAG